MKIKALLYFLSITSLSAVSHADGLQTQMDDLYIQMSNYTQPGAFETQQRGGVQGGRFTLKQQIVRHNLVQFVPPSARGGCGGIDVFGGSFSYINADQMVETLRAVASNASSYAFSLALETACPSCMKWMNELQAKIQKANTHMMDSCQIAQGIVTNTRDSIRGTANWNEVLDSTNILDAASDTFDVFNHVSTVHTAFQKAEDIDPVFSGEKNLGSTLYKLLKKNSALQSSIENADTELIEIILSTVGSPHYVPGTGSEGSGQVPISEPLNPILVPKQAFKILLEGKDTPLKIYNCANNLRTGADICMLDQSDANSRKEIQWTGISTKLLDLYTGPNGIISNARLGNFSPSYSNAHKNVAAGLPHNLNSKIYTLIQCSPDVAESFLHTHIKSISIDYVDQIFTQVLFASRNIVRSSSDKDVKDIEDFFKKTDALWSNAKRDLRSEYGNPPDIESSYNNTIHAVRASCPDFRFPTIKKIENQ